MHAFKTGDKVVLKDNENLESFGYTKGKVYTITRPNMVHPETNPATYLVDDFGGENSFYESRFRAAVQGQDYVPAVTVQEYIESIGKDSTGMILSEDPATRKATPITTGVLDYFPRAVAAVAQCSKAGNDQHNPGQPLHWAKEKSTDHADCIARHLIDRTKYDTDGIRHAAKLAWRALAHLEILLEQEDANKA